MAGRPKKVHGGARPGAGRKPGKVPGEPKRDVHLWITRDEESKLREHLEFLREKSSESEID